MNGKQFWMTVLAVVVAQVLAGFVVVLVTQKTRSVVGGRVGS